MKAKDRSSVKPDPRPEWKEELHELFKEEIEEHGMGIEYFLQMYPTKETWEEIGRIAELISKNGENFEMIRSNFEDDNAFDDFLIQARNNTSLLDKFLDAENKKIFLTHLDRNLPRSSGAKKLINYFNGLTRNEEFQKEIRLIRKEYNIPADGAPFSKKDYDKVLSIESDPEELIELCIKYGFYSYQWFTIFRIHLFFNNPHFKLRPYISLDFDLCKVVNEKDNHILPTKGKTGFTDEGEFSNYLEFKKDLQQREDNEFPIALRISPFASERDILEFIKRNFYEILRLQNKYRGSSKNSKIGKLKKKSSEIQMRNDFIYDNRYLPRKEIMKRLIEKFGGKDVVDVGYIGKIISLEKKKRKEV